MYDACERHDWLYDFSDDHRVWCSGEHAKAKLLEAAAETPENQAVYDAWRAYMSSGPPWDTPKNPKPARPVEWTLLCKRTEDPKLSWIERELNRRGIKHRRGGPSFHACFTLYVPEKQLDAADEFLQLPAPLKLRRHYKTIDDIPDDHPMFST